MLYNTDKCLEVAISKAYDLCLGNKKKKKPLLETQNSASQVDPMACLGIELRASYIQGK